MITSTTHWHTTLPTEAARWFSGLSVPWWVAGGWALDLFVGHQTRPHGDLDIGILRRDAAVILQHLSSWDFFEASRGELVELRARTAPRPDVNSLWCRPAGSALWVMELMLDHGDADVWHFRRAPQICRPLTAAIHRSAQGIPYLAPEIQLLYKARSPRPRDHADFNRVAPLLDVNGRTWLRDSLQTCNAPHEWIQSLG
jgi:hypothetical protein